MSFSGTPDARGVFSPPDGNTTRCTVLDGFFEGQALVAETLRQCKQVVDDTVTVWVDDARAVAKVLKSWCPDGLVIDEKLPKDKEMSILLRENPNYPKLAPSTATLQAVKAELQNLNIPNFEPVVSPDFVESLQDILKYATSTVICTNAFYLLHEKLPAMEDKMLRQATVDDVINKIGKKNHVFPPEFLEAFSELTGKAAA